MQLIIVTGLSGAGKSNALNCLEDLGYYCIDNMPPALIVNFVDLLRFNKLEMDKAAVCIDVRMGDFLKGFDKQLEKLTDVDCRIVYLEASDEALIRRYKETRRNHPLAGAGRVEKGIALERQKVGFLKKRANYILDTSRLLTRELKAELSKIFVENREYKNLYITVLSFGFKYGIPNDADLVFDVRFLPNPYYIDELRPQSGNDKPVQEYVMNNELAREFLEKLVDMVQFLMPNYAAEGKHQLVIAIGCTGGKHRSVTIANALYDRLTVTEEDYGLKKEHRDLAKDAVVKAK